MLAADVEVVNQMPVLEVKAVTGRGIAVRDQDAAVACFDRHMRLDQVGAAAHVRRDLGRDVADAGVEHELPAMMGARRILGKARPKTVVQRQHLVRLRLPPPFGDHRLQPLGLALGKVVGL